MTLGLVVGAGLIGLGWAVGVYALRKLRDERQ